MKVLLIGGGGFIGSNIVDALINNGDLVTIITRGKSKQLFKPHQNLTIMHGNRSDKKFMSSVADLLFDAVIDMTAFVENDSASAIKIFEGKTSHFIHTSTVSVYMVSNDVQCPITEDQDKGKLMELWGMNPFGMQYGIDKRKCEDVLWKAHEEKNYPVTFVRPPYVCGPHDPMARDYFWIQRILDDGPLLIPGAGDFASQHIYVKDLAKAYLMLLQNESTIGHAYNVASEEIYSLNDYLDSLCKILGKNPERVNVDLNVFLNQSFSVSSEGHAFPFNTFRTAIFSLDKIKKDIGFTSTTFEHWMPNTIEWYLNKYNKDSVGYSQRQKEIDFTKQWKNKKYKFISALS